MKKWKRIKKYCLDQEECKNCKFNKGFSLGCCLSFSLLFRPMSWTKKDHPKKSELKGYNL